MIISWIIQVYSFVLTIAFDLMLHVIGPIQYAPTGFDAFAISSISQIYQITQDFWPLIPVFQCIIAYIPIKIGLMVAKVFLGNRMPTHV